MGVDKADIKVFLNVFLIVVGVVIASIGEIKFVLIGVLFQLGGIIFEAIRLVMVERLLSSAEYKMDPLVSLYYFAPICAVMNFCVAMAFEIPHIQMQDLYNVGLSTLFANASLAFALNVSVVFLVRQRLKGHFQVLTQVDWPHLQPCNDPLRCPQRRSTGCSLDSYMGHPNLSLAVLRLFHRSEWTCVLQAWRGNHQSHVFRDGPRLGGVWSQASGTSQDHRLWYSTHSTHHRHRGRRAYTWL